MRHFNCASPVSRMFRAAAVCLPVLSGSSSVDAKSCGKRDAEAALKALAAIDSWGQLHAYYSRFGVCDDGGPADDITERVVRLILGRWSDVSALASESKGDAGFLQFVLSHIDSTADTDDLSKIRDLATRECPSDQTALCGKVRGAAKKALK